MTPEVGEAIAKIGTAFPGAGVSVREEQDRVVVILDRVDTGEQYVQKETWIGFQITFQYPYSDVYPHFVRGDLTRVDGQPLGDGTSATTFEGRAAIQLSRRSNRLNPDTDTAALKLLKVLAWLRSL